MSEILTQTSVLTGSTRVVEVTFDVPARCAVALTAGDSAEVKASLINFTPAVKHRVHFYRVDPSWRTFVFPFGELVTDAGGALVSGDVLDISNLVATPDTPLTATVTLADPAWLLFMAFRGLPREGIVEAQDAYLGLDPLESHNVALDPLGLGTHRLVAINSQSSDAPGWNSGPWNGVAWNS